jgi:hypothetical protein
MVSNHDRAGIVATAVIKITTASFISEAERRLHFENLLRDELADLERQVANERDGPNV